MKENPYRSPNEQAAVQREPEKDSPYTGIWIVLGTIVMALLGNVAGSLIMTIGTAEFPNNFYRGNVMEVLEIRHQLGLILLALGGLAGGYLGERCYYWFQSGSSTVSGTRK